jgi:hypothetical protein
MVLENEKSTVTLSFPKPASPFFSILALLGIPAAGFIAIVFDIEFSRLIYGQANPLLLGVEIASLMALLVLVLLLRSRLALPSAPRGFYRAVLDFLAVSRWHAAVKLCLVGLLALPIAWFVIDDRWFFFMLRSIGRRALAMSDMQQALDGLAVGYQITLIGGLPLLFVMHLLCRWKPGNRILPWLLVLLFFVGTLIATVLIVAVLHFEQ